MTWDRFEDRKMNNCPVFAVTLAFSQGHSLNCYLAFNQRIREQLLPGHPYCDLFLDRAGKCLGMRFLREPTDIHSYKVANYKGKFRSSARLSATAMVRAWRLTPPCWPYSYRAELKGDPREGVWSFSIAPLMKTPV